MPTWPSYTIEEASAASGYSIHYLRRLCREDKLEFERVGRIYLIRVSSLEQYIAQVQDPDDGRTGPRKRRA